MPVRPCALPEHALLGKYARVGGHADCYTTQIDRRVSHAEYVEAFYTTAVFKLERLLLAGLVSKPSTDAQAGQLAAGAREDFSAWHVEARSSDQLLLCDLHARTRSWLMVAPIQAEGAASTRLYFGSAVVPARRSASGPSTLGFAFHALLGFHKLYSRVLLSAARSRLLRASPH